MLCGLIVRKWYQMLPDALQLRPGDDGGKRLLHPHRVGVVLGICAPDQDIGYPINTKRSGTHGGLRLTTDHEAPQPGEIAQFRRNRPCNLVVREAQMSQSAITVGEHAVPLVEGSLAKPESTEGMTLQQQNG